MRLRSTTRSKKQKDRSSSPFRNNDLMLAEHDRCRPALAATTATFPLNDVDFALIWDFGPASLQTLLIRTICVSAFVAIEPQGRDDKSGGDRRDRTDDLMLAKHALSQLSYVPKRGAITSDGRESTAPPSGSATPTSPRCGSHLVGLGRLERPTSPLSGVRSNHLSYRPSRTGTIPKGHPGPTDVWM